MSVSGSDIFLHVETRQAGKVKGEARADSHVEDIEIRGWRWGAQAGSAIGATAATARRSYQRLVVFKAIDSASTALISALATNDEVRVAKLTMRKAGGDALDYYSMTLGEGRVVDFNVEVDTQGRATERVEFSFGKIDIEYQCQQADGSSGGSSSFSDEVL